MSYSRKKQKTHHNKLRSLDLVSLHSSEVKKTDKFITTFNAGSHTNHAFFKFFDQRSLVNLTKTSKTFRSVATNEIENRFYNSIKDLAIIFPNLKEKIFTITDNTTETKKNRTPKLLKLLEAPLNAYLDNAVNSIEPAKNVAIAVTNLFKLDVLLNKFNPDINAKLKSLKEKLNIDLHDYIYNLSPCDKKAETTVKEYFIRGADPNYLNKERFHIVPTFEIAIKAGHPVAVKEFITAGANVNSVNQNSIDYYAREIAMSPLMHAAEGPSLEIVEILVAAGANIKAKMNDPRYSQFYGRSALYHALGSKRYSTREEIAIFLIKNGADLTGLPIYHSALIMASCQGCLEVVDFLLTHCADRCAVNERSPFDNTTALMNAIENREPKIVERLLKGGADPTMLDECDCTAIEAAEAHKSAKIGGYTEDFNAGYEQAESLEEAVAEIEAEYDEIIDILEQYTKPSIRKR